MPRYFAFLRAINVGGHNVKMSELRRLFESLGFSNVETFIVSGNVVFESRMTNTRSLEKRIEEKLREGLGYEVSTFIRTDAEMAAIAAYIPFQQSEIENAAAFNIAFLTDALDKESTMKVMALGSDLDTFHVDGREVYWLCRKRQSDSKFSNAVLEKTLGRRSSLRGVKTVKKMAEEFGSSEPGRRSTRKATRP